MKVIVPIDFTSSMLTSTNATESTANYSAGTTYALGARVVEGTNIYESLVANNIGNLPSTSPTKWILVQPTNPYAAFDTQVSTATVKSGGTYTFVIQPGVPINAVAFINLDADITEITIRDGGPAGAIIFEGDAGLAGTQVYDWYQYFFFDPVLRRTQLVFSGITEVLLPHISVTITKGSGDISLGAFLFGKLYTIGGTQYGVRAGIKDYSVKETDEYGNTIFVERNYSKRMTANVYIENSSLNRVQNTLYGLRAKPAVWIASDDPTYEEALVVFGFYKDFSTTISYPTMSMCDIEIEGLT